MAVTTVMLEDWEPYKVWNREVVKAGFRKVRRVLGVENGALQGKETLRLVSHGAGGPGLQANYEKEDSTVGLRQLCPLGGNQDGIRMKNRWRLSGR